MGNKHLVFNYVYQFQPFMSISFIMFFGCSTVMCFSFLAPFNCLLSEFWFSVWFIFFLILPLHKQCLRPPYGVAYLATKKNYVGFNSGTRHLRSLVDEEGIFGAHLVKEIGERDVWKFFLKWSWGKYRNSKNITQNKFYHKIVNSTLLFVDYKTTATPPLPFYY